MRTGSRWISVGCGTAWDDAGFSTWISAAGGAKLVALLNYLVTDTDLVWASIESYVWGMRTWMKLQHQADPAYGVEHWDMLQDACMVLTHVPAEPRKELPLEVLQAILGDLDPGVFWEAQFGLFLVLLLFTFSRSECPSCWLRG